MLHLLSNAVTIQQMGMSYKSNPNKTGCKHVKYCCRALQTSVEEGFFGTMLLHHPVLDRDNYELTDESFRRACCSFGNDMSCNEFVRKRPINDCTGYQPPNIGNNIIVHFQTLLSHTCLYSHRFRRSTLHYI